MTVEPTPKVVYVHRDVKIIKHKRIAHHVVRRWDGREIRVVLVPIIKFERLKDVFDISTTQEK